MTTTKMKTRVRANAEPARPAPKAALTLAEYQDMFQRAVISGDRAILNEITDNSRTTRDVLFGVYENAYAARLVEVLSNDYESLRAYLGEKAFDEMARAYVARHPSQTQNARWFGQHMPAFLSTAPAYRARPELADLARIELALGIAFDAKDAAVLDLADLAAIAPEDWARLIFHGHPSAQLLQCATDAMALWTAMTDNGEASEQLALADGVQNILVWRYDAMPKLRVIEPEEAMMWQEAQRGLTFAGLCELIATYAEPETAAMRAAQYLQGWVAGGLLTRTELLDL